jgi:hypothetical protein
MGHGIRDPGSGRMADRAMTCDRALTGCWRRAAWIGAMNHGRMASWRAGNEKVYARREGLRSTMTRNAGNGGGLRFGQNVPISGSPVRIFTSQTFTHEKVDHDWIIEISWWSRIGDPG